MTDRLSLTNALADANIDRQKAERIATEIFDAIRGPDLGLRQQRIAQAFEDAGVAHQKARGIAAVIIAMIRAR